jgi:hypothetical protein
VCAERETAASAPAGRGRRLVALPCDAATQRALAWRSQLLGNPTTKRQLLWREKARNVNASDDRKWAFAAPWMGGGAGTGFPGTNTLDRESIQRPNPSGSVFFFNQCPILATTRPTRSLDGPEFAPFFFFLPNASEGGSARRLDSVRGGCRSVVFFYHSILHMLGTADPRRRSPCPLEARVEPAELGFPSDWRQLGCVRRARLAVGRCLASFRGG